MEQQLKKVLILDACSGHEQQDPRAYLVETSAVINEKIMKSLELEQPGALRTGGNWRQIFIDGDIEYKLLSSGRKSKYKEGDYDWIYNVTWGNY
jgi:hypothetical protein